MIRDGRNLALADNLARVVDRVGGAVTLARLEGPQVGHRAVLPEGGMVRSRREGGVANDLPRFVDVVRDADAEIRQHASIGDERMLDPLAVDDIDLEANKLATVVDRGAGRTRRGKGPEVSDRPVFPEEDTLMARLIRTHPEDLPQGIDAHCLVERVSPHPSEVANRETGSGHGNRPEDRVSEAIIGKALSDDLPRLVDVCGPRLGAVSRQGPEVYERAVVPKDGASVAGGVRARADDLAVFVERDGRYGSALERPKVRHSSVIPQHGAVSAASVGRRSDDLA